jgi:hypothetical protein
MSAREPVVVLDPALEHNTPLSAAASIRAALRGD